VGVISITLGFESPRRGRDFGNGPTSTSNKANGQQYLWSGEVPRKYNVPLPCSMIVSLSKTIGILLVLLIASNCEAPPPMDEAPAELPTGAIYYKQVSASAQVGTLREFPDLSDCPWGELRAPSGDEPPVGWFWQAPDQCEIIAAIFVQANCGEPSAQFRLAYWYRQGLMDLEEDSVKSYAWYDIAAANGRVDAVADRDRLAQSMVSSDIEKARSLTVEWNPLECPGDEWRNSPKPRMRLP